MVKKSSRSSNKGGAPASATRARGRIQKVNKSNTPRELEQPSTLLERLSNPQTVERQLIGLTAVSLSHDMQLEFFYDKCKFDKTKNHRSAHT